MNAIQLNDHFYWIGAQDPDLRVFDIIMETKFGTTYNSYLLKTDAGIVLFESVKDKFFDEYIEHINSIASVDEITHIVVNHTEPDHSGSIAKLIAMNPNIVVVTSVVANLYLKEIVNAPFQVKTVKDNEALIIGNKTLRFISAPNLHWPDTMYTYIEEDHVLVTCDSFGAHYAHEDVLLSKVGNRADYQEGFDYYTNMIMGPFKPFILKAMDKIKPLQIDLIAPGHGPVVDCDIQQTIDNYIAFASESKQQKRHAVIVYVSAYGYTKQMAQIICDAFNSSSIPCDMFDLIETNRDEVIQKMIDADIILYGCPTLLNDALPPIYDVMNQILSPYHGKKLVSAFGSYGWSGEAVPNLIARLKQQRMEIIDEGLRIKFKMSDAQIEEVKTYANNLIQHTKNIPV